MARLQQGQQLISGGASAVKEPRHFEVRKSSSQVTPMHFFPQKVDHHLLVVALKKRAANAVRFTVKIKQIKRSDMVTFLFCSHYYRSKAIRRARQGGARA